MSTDGALDVDEVELEWYGGNDVALRVRDCALVQVYDIDLEAGTARVRVFASLAADAPTLFDGRVDVHRPDHDMDER